MQQEARYTPVDTGQRRRKSSSGLPEHNARSNCFCIPNFNIILCMYIYIYIVINYYCLLFCADVAISRHTILQQQFARARKRHNILCAAHTREFTLVPINTQVSA